MKIPTPRTVRLSGLAVFLLLVTASLTSDAPVVATVDLAGDDAGTAAGDPSIRRAMHAVVGQAVLADAARIHGTDSPQYCATRGLIATCIHPDTPPERVEELLRNLPTWDGDGRYQLGDRWNTTAIDGDAGNTGAPINLTYSFLDDGVMIPGNNNEPDSASRLYLVMNGHFGSEAVWKAMFAEMFDDWGKHIGVTYEEVDDDGAAFPNFPGELGLRGDVRIGSHPIDGQYGVLAYNYYPDVGDMVLDSSDNWGAPYNDHVFMRNIIRHEHGHGLGLGHVSPENCQKLMEPYICQNFDGPQDDDLRGAMRNYGDTHEFNNNAAGATDLGALEGPFVLELPASLTTSVDFDYYRFTTTGAAELDVVLDPVGQRYDLEGVMVETDEVMDLAFRVLGGENGADMLIQVNDVGLGDDEILVDFPLPAPGDYWILVFRAAGTPDVQRYDLALDVTLTDITNVAREATPAAELAPTLYPNPFNPRTTLRFHAAQAGPVQLSVYDVAGRLVRSIDGRADAAGWQELTWDGRTNRGDAAPSGAYVLRARSAQQTWTARGVLLE